MNVRKHDHPLPSAEWIALGVGGLGVLLSGLFSVSWLGFTILAVFVPPLLREMGWLRDGDEHLERAFQRAGLHASVAVGLLLALARSGLWTHGSGPFAEALPTLGLLTDVLVLVFLLSLLQQYWGARKGVPRFLLGYAAYSVLVGAGALLHGQGWAFVLAALGAAAALVLLAWLGRQWPRVGGAVLAALAILFVVLMLRDAPGLPGGVGTTLPATLITTILFGATGAGLLREGAGDE